MRDHLFVATPHQPALCQRCGSVEEEHDPSADLSPKSATKQFELPRKSERKRINTPFVQGGSFESEGEKFIFRRKTLSGDTYFQSEKGSSKWLVQEVSDPLHLYESSTEELEGK